MQTNSALFCARQTVLVACLGLIFAASRFAFAAPEIRFFNDDSLSDREKHSATEATEQIIRLFSNWTWKNRIDGRWEIHLVHSKSLHQLEAGSESAVAPSEDHNPPLLILAWDLLLETSDLPMITAFEHVAAHLYRIATTGDDGLADDEMAYQLTAEGAFLALSEVRRASEDLGLTTEMRQKIDREWAANFAAAYPGVPPDQIERFDCTALMSDSRRKN